LASAESDDISLVSFFSNEDVPLAQDRPMPSKQGIRSPTIINRVVLSDLNGSRHPKRSRKRKTKMCSAEKNGPLTLQSLDNHHLLQSAVFLSKPSLKTAQDSLKRQSSCEDEENREPNLQQNKHAKTEGECSFRTSKPFTPQLSTQIF